MKKLKFIPEIDGFQQAALDLLDLASFENIRMDYQAFVPHVLSRIEKEYPGACAVYEVEQMLEVYLQGASPLQWAVEGGFLLAVLDHFGRKALPRRKLRHPEKRKEFNLYLRQRIEDCIRLHTEQLLYCFIVSSLLPDPWVPQKLLETALAGQLAQMPTLSEPSFQLDFKARESGESWVGQQLSISLERIRAGIDERGACPILLYNPSFSFFASKLVIAYQFYQIEKDQILIKAYVPSLDRFTIFINLNDRLIQTAQNSSPIEMLVITEYEAQPFPKLKRFSIPFFQKLLWQINRWIKKYT